MHQPRLTGEQCEYACTTHDALVQQQQEQNSRHPGVSMPELNDNDAAQHQAYCAVNFELSGMKHRQRQQQHQQLALEEYYSERSSKQQAATPLWRWGYKIGARHSNPHNPAPL